MHYIQESYNIFVITSALYQNVQLHPYIPVHNSPEILKLCGLPIAYRNCLFQKVTLNPVVNIIEVQQLSGFNTFDATLHVDSI